MAVPMMVPIEGLGVDSAYLAHPGRQVCFRCFNQQMIVVVHETISVTQPVKTLHHLPQNPEELIPITVITEDIPPGIAPRGNMINSAWIFDT